MTMLLLLSFLLSPAVEAAAPVKPAAARKAKADPAATAEAERRMARGAAAMKAAASPSELKDAGAEFEAAAAAVPGLADAHYNAGVAYAKAGDHAAAVRNLRRYVELATNAADVKEAKAKLYEQEFLLEKAAKAMTRLAGTWGAAGHDGEIEKMFGKVQRQFRVAPVAGGRYEIRLESLSGTAVMSSESFDIAVEGEVVTGTYSWDGKAPVSGRRLCDAVNSPVRGALSADGKRLQLKFDSVLFETGCATKHEDWSLLKVE